MITTTNFIVGLILAFALGYSLRAWQTFKKTKQKQEDKKWKHKTNLKKRLEQKNQKD